MERPLMCYVYLPVDKTIGVVKFGESGYYKTEYSANETNEAWVDNANEKLGVTKAESEAMMILSMGNNSLEDWKSKYDSLASSLKEKMEKKANAGK